MSAKLFLRIAAVVMLLHAVGHTMGALSWKKAPNTAVAQVINGMQNQHFDFMGRSASLADFYNGYGISMIFVLLLVSVLLWLLAANPVKNMLVTLGLFLLGLAICEYVYFFAFAAVFSLTAAICVWLARLKTSA
ncbi:MAG: hypothetical protein JWQ79_3596 [Mucilaginibacter sp.]|nr:hypothetical protein [Mucilaginibacter sp.]